MASVIKLVLAALVILSAFMIAKRSPMLGAVIISLPLTSMIAMIFLYYDTHDTAKVAEFARAIPPVLLPSVLFFYAFSFLIELGNGFAMAMGLATAGMLGGYGLCLWALRFWH